jgi:ankyrin repeat protein
VQDVKMALEGNPEAGVYDEFGLSALHVCLLNDCQECALAMIPLLASKVGVDYPTQKGKAAQLDGTPITRPHNRTALFTAAKMGSKPFMQALLALDANINHRDSQGRTPLDTLAYDIQRISGENPDFPLDQTHCQETVEFLKEHGAQSDNV